MQMKGDSSATEEKQWIHGRMLEELSLVRLSYLTGIKAGERGAQHFKKESRCSEGVIHVMVVGVWVVAMPVQNVVSDV